MDKYTINLEALGKQLNAPKMIKYAEVKDQLKKIAFDVVIFRDDPEKLWQVIDGEDGNQYIVSMYTDDAISKSSSDENPWAVELNRQKTSATIFYRDTPIRSIDLVKNAVSDALDFKANVPRMLKENQVLVAKMINDLDDEYRNHIVSQYPELLKR